MRLDQWLFEKGVFDSREKARREIAAGNIRESRSGKILDKPGMAVKGELEIIVREKERFVGRGGEKLFGFLHAHQISVKDRVCLDVGSSTGGFTDCLLQSGAKHIFAIDVGTHQMDEKLRHHSQVTLWEETDARQLSNLEFHEEPDLVVVDVAFISLKLVVPPIVQRFPNAEFIFLFKPQFEVGRFKRRKKGGVVFDHDAEEALTETLQFLSSLRLNSSLVSKSAVKGAKGNQEYFIRSKMEPGTNQIPQSIFRAYDIRGVAERDLSNSLFEQLGFVLGERVKKLGKKTFKVGVGSDSRPHSPRLVESLIKGLHRHEEIDVWNLGNSTTPLVYFASHHYELDGAFQVTASHNPMPDNGLKMMIGQSTLLGESIAQLGYEIRALAPFKEESPKRELIEKTQELQSEYLHFLHHQFQNRIPKKLKVVADAANGMAGMILRKALSPFCSSLEILFEEVDCRFPNHPADPTVAEHLKDLQKKILETKADIGLAYDGDADRLGVVTAKGRVLFGDEILMLLAEQVLKERPGAKIIGEVKCSQKLFQNISAWGGEAIMYKTGHSLIKDKMKKSGAPLAGEMSGHLFFADRFFGFDDAIYASLRVLESVGQLGKNLDEWISSFPSPFVTPEWRVEIPIEDFESSMERVKAETHRLSDVHTNEIDGIRATFSDGTWFLVRASNTQPVLVIRIESPSKNRILELREWLQKVLGQSLPHFA